MTKNIWNKLAKPIYALAPMAGVTDMAFRQICCKYGADLTYSEMASATALLYNPEKTLELLEFSKKERPYIVQLFGSEPEHFALAAKLITEEIEPDGIDINFGCPVAKVTKQGAGAALMQDLDKSRAVVEAVLANTHLPVSIKVRTQSGDLSLIDLLKKIQDLDVKALMIHGRSLAQGFSGSIDTEIVKEARKYFSGVILINGGINDFKDGQRILTASQADGLGIARGAMGNPGIFTELKKGQARVRDLETVKKEAWQHAKLANELKGKAGMIEMRKILCAYVQGLPNARRLRDKAIKVEKLSDVREMFK